MLSKKKNFISKPIAIPIFAHNFVNPKKKKKIEQ